MSAETASEPVPREPSAYRPTNHFRDRFRDAHDETPRHLDDEIVRECIKNGTVEKVNREKYRFREWFGGVEYAIVVATDRGVVLTGHPVAIDEDTAWESGRWTTDQLDDIRSFLASR